MAARTLLSSKGEGARRRLLGRWSEVNKTRQQLGRGDASHVNELIDDGWCRRTDAVIDWSLRVVLMREGNCIGMGKRRGRREAEVEGHVKRMEWMFLGEEEGREGN